MPPPRRWVANLDLYRKVPGDLLEGSRRGSVLSLVALGSIVTLFFLETKAFLTTTTLSQLQLDPNKQEKLKVTFNITMMDLKCDYATIDVISVLGTEQNVTHDIHRYAVDADGLQRHYMHRNLKQTDIQLMDTSITETIEDLHANGQDALPLDPETLSYALNEHTFVFVDFFASWCSHCRALAPTWETLAEIMLDAAQDQLSKSNQHEHLDDYSDEAYQEALKVHMPVLIAKVDCVEHHDLCMQQGIRGYPTLRLFHNGQPFESGDYWGHRTVLALTQYLEFAEQMHKDELDRYLTNSGAVERRMNVSQEERAWAEALERTRRGMQEQWNPDEHPGCMLTGTLWLNRAPSHFYIQAQSATQNLVPHMTNVSHEINHLMFGDALAMMQHQATKEMKKMRYPDNYHESLAPMNGNVYVTRQLHEAYHHYMKLVSTNLYSYQVLQSSQLAYYQPNEVPMARFAIDLSPISVVYRPKTRRWYDYITSLMAIIGGTFTILGVVESSLRTASQAVGKRRKMRLQPSHKHFQ